MSSLSSDTLINPQDLFDVSVSSLTTNAANEAATLGCLATTGDGRYFRYVIAGGTALVPGTLQASIAETTANERVAMAAASIGATSVSTTASITVTANQYTGGYLMISSSTGAGYSYQIGTHAAFTSAAATFNLVDPITVALTSSSQVSLVPSPWNGVIQSPTSLTGVPVGVAVAATPISYYGWVQTVGPANVLCQATMTVGNRVCASTTTAGAVTVETGSLITPVVGNAMQGVTATQYGPIFLNIS